MTTLTDEITARGALALLLQGYSTEVTVRDGASLDNAARLLPPEAEVFIASLPKDSVERFVSATARLRREGLVPVPHIVARNIANRASLDDLLARLAGEAGVTRALVLGGDRDTPAGDFSSALELIETGLFQKHGFHSVAFGCYPEGHPRIPDEILESALLAKLDRAREMGLRTSLVSQFCFEGEPIIRFAGHLRDLGITAPLRVGVAGPSQLATLMKYAVICGVGASLRALRERQNLAVTMLSGVTPEAVLLEVAVAQAKYPHLGIAGVHFFTFGSLARSARWAQNQIDKEKDRL